MTVLKESLSALVDGECSAAELDALLDACSGQPKLLRLYGRHCAVSEVHAGRHVHRASEDFCAAVMRGVEAPVQRQRVQGSGRSRSRLRRRRWRAAGGLALAASFGAIVAVTGYRFAAIPGASQMVGTTVASARAGSATLARAEAGVHQVQWSQLDPSTTRRLDDYIMEHASYGSGQVMGSALSYARVAAQQVRYSPASGAH